MIVYKWELCNTTGRRLCYTCAVASMSAAAKVSRSSVVVSRCGEIRSTGEVNSPGAR